MLNAFFDDISRFTPQQGRSKKQGRSYSNSVIDTQNLIDSKDSGWSADESSKLWLVVLFVCVVVGIFFIFTARAISIQILDREEYVSLAQRNRIREIPIQAERGVIFDRNGDILVRNKPAFSLEINTQFCNSVNLQEEDTAQISCFKIVEKLSQLVEIEQERVLEEIKQGRAVILLSTGLEKDDILSIEANIKDYPGLVVVTHPVRNYVYSDSMAHVLGYVGLDDESLTPVVVGKQGLEETYNKQLSGIPGMLVVQMDSTGTEYSVVAQQGALPGKNITTYIDAGLQQKAYELLKSVVENPKESVSIDATADAGVVVAQDPQTGGILAMVSYPAFDPNKLVVGLSSDEYAALSNNPRFPFYNRAISATYPPGSTFKMVVASGALMEGVVSEHTLIYDPGYLIVSGFRFNNWKLDGHGDVNIRRALQVSNDTYFYTIGGGYGDIRGLGITKLSNWAKSFGFGSFTGVDINGEVPGYMPDGTSREWYLGDTYITSIGQGDVLATPLQVNNMVSYFANGGFLLQPRIVRSIDGVGETEIQVLAQSMVSPENYKIIREGMNLAVEPGGTGWPLFDLDEKYGVKFAGKTGTSEYIDPTGEARTHALFTAFAPYDEKDYRASEIALTVFLEGGGGGANEAAPIARELFSYWFDKSSKKSVLDKSDDL